MSLKNGTKKAPQITESFNVGGHFTVDVVQGRGRIRERAHHAFAPLVTELLRTITTNGGMLKYDEPTQHFKQAYAKPVTARNVYNRMVSELHTLVSSAGYGHALKRSPAGVRLMVKG